MKAWRQAAWEAEAEPNEANGLKVFIFIGSTGGPRYNSVQQNCAELCSFGQTCPRRIKDEYGRLGRLRDTLGAMKQKEILTQIIGIGIVPVVRTSSADTAILAIEAIYRGGVRAAEITMTVPGAVRALEKIADRFGDKIVLGAGTVLDPETARICMLAGAEFLVTPSLKPATIEMAKRYAKPICPGALTPTEVLTAWEAGADAVKIFPCGNVGGPKYIKALKGPFPQIEMIPTGGVNLDTAGEFLKAGACAVAVGGELVDAKLIREGRYDLIEERAREYLAAIARARAEMAD
jgi:2-dehydro-3-deoxyphosphogluconate aldolase/(4S)-4-hydroxy-2-oxoglutarate aldolase